MKKKLAMFAALALAATAVIVPVQADDAKGSSDVTVIVSGSAIETDQPAVIQNSRTLVPFRAIGEALGCEVDWEADTKTVVLSQGDVTTKLAIGSTELTVVKGETEATVEIDQPAIIINSRTMVPVRFLSENLGFVVDWDAETKTVTVNKSAVADVVATPAAVDTDEATTEEVSEETTEETTVEATTEEASEETTVEVTTEEE